MTPPIDFALVPDWLQSAGREVGDAWPLAVMMGAIYVLARGIVHRLKVVIRTEVEPMLASIATEGESSHMKTREDIANLRARLEEHARDEEVVLQDLTIWQIRHDAIHGYEQFNRRLLPEQSKVGPARED